VKTNIDLDEDVESRPDHSLGGSDEGSICTYDQAQGRFQKSTLLSKATTF
jgi:hypothetical protein